MNPSGMPPKVSNSGFQRIANAFKSFGKSLKNALGIQQKTNDAASQGITSTHQTQAAPVPAVTTHAFSQISIIKQANPGLTEQPPKASVIPKKAASDPIKKQLYKDYREKYDALTQPFMLPGSIYNPGSAVQNGAPKAPIQYGNIPKGSGPLKYAQLPPEATSPQSNQTTPVAGARMLSQAQVLDSVKEQMKLRTPSPGAKSKYDTDIYDVVEIPANVLRALNSAPPASRPTKPSPPDSPQTLGKSSQLPTPPPSSPSSSPAASPGRLKKNHGPLPPPPTKASNHYEAIDDPFG